MESWSSCWRAILFFLLFTIPFGNPHPPDGTMEKTIKASGIPSRAKRSPFIMAFQVTKPPGMFQMALRPPYIINMMSNLTRSFLSSGITDFLRRGLSASFGQNTVSVASPQGITSRQEDVEIFDSK